MSSNKLREILASEGLIPMQGIFPKRVKEGTREVSYIRKPHGDYKIYWPVPLRFQNTKLPGGAGKPSILYRPKGATRWDVVSLNFKNLPEMNRIVENHSQEIVS